MRTLWEIVNKHFDSESAAAAFLTINIICWTAGTLAAGLLFCLITGTPAALCITKLMCAAIYAGIIVGLFGGIFIPLPQKNTVALLRSWCRCGCSRLLQRLPGLRVYGCLRRP